MQRSYILGAGILFRAVTTTPMERTHGKERNMSQPDTDTAAQSPSSQQEPQIQTDGRRSHSEQVNQPAQTSQSESSHDGKDEHALHTNLKRGMESRHLQMISLGGVIGTGDVQWMTAGGGIIHEEFHSAGYAARGGPFEMVQLWVNLPAKDKMTPPGYQPITAAQIPVVELPEGAGRVRVIAGQWSTAQGPARTFSPITMLDVQLAAGKSVELPQPEGWTTLVVVASGSASVNGADPVTGPAVVTLSTASQGVTVRADSDAKLLLLSGEPIDEPVVGYGPFVMNSQQQIVQAINDFNSGRFGQGLN